MYADFVRQQNDKIDGNWHLIPKRMIFSTAEIGKYRQRLTFFTEKSLRQPNRCSVKKYDADASHFIFKGAVFKMFKWNNALNLALRTSNV